MAQERESDSTPAHPARPLCSPWNHIKIFVFPEIQTAKGLPERLPCWDLYTCAGSTADIRPRPLLPPHGTVDPVRHGTLRSAVSAAEITAAVRNHAGQEPGSDCSRGRRFLRTASTFSGNIRSPGGSALPSLLCLPCLSS